MSPGEPNHRQGLRKAVEHVEFWRSGGPPDLEPSRQAARVEAEGWDGQMFMDSQSLGADPYVLMGYWAAVTRRLGLGTGVTNPLTRHAAVTAGAIASVQAISNGRAVLGIGRGDSALAYLGYAPSPVARFERALENLQALLSGKEISWGSDELSGRARSIDSLSLGDRPESARLDWLPHDLPKVPLDVAATGPKVIEVAARQAERVTFSVGASLERLAWAVERADAARLVAGIERPVSYGAQVVVVCHHSPERVREAATKLTLPLARFQVLNTPSPAGPVDEPAHYSAVRRGYAMTKHSDFAGEDKLVGESLDFEFVRRFSVVGDPDHCIERITSLIRLGIDRFVVFGPGFHDDDQQGASLFSTAVLPGVRDWLARRRTADTRPVPRDIISPGQSLSD